MIIIELNASSCLALMKIGWVHFVFDRITWLRAVSRLAAFQLALLVICFNKTLGKWQKMFAFRPTRTQILMRGRAYRSGLE